MNTVYTYKILEKLRSPGEIGLMSVSEKKELAFEVRDKITEVVSINGGHLGPNLGVVEIIIACHVVFQLDRDRLVFDVGHQSYPHKIVTGRFSRFSTLRQRLGISGYPYGVESQFDVFRSGHASTAISTSLGLTRGYDLMKEMNLELKKPHVIALVGDGALTGGMAFEALNHCGELNDPVIIILNDNSMSISPTVGGLAKTSNVFRNSPFYNKMRDGFLASLKKSSKWGESLETFTTSILGRAHHLISPSQIFTTLGLEYFGPVDGNNIEEMIAILKLAKKRKKTVVVHALTKKGVGYKPSGSKSKVMIGPHALSPQKKLLEKPPLEVGGETSDSTSKQKSQEQIIPREKESFSASFVDALLELCKTKKNIVAVTAAMPDGTGLTKYAKQRPKHYFDVGICEAHATGFCAGLATSGIKPIFAVYSTFLQRAFDQIFHEIVLQENISMVFAIDRAGLVGDDGPSHHGIFDIAYLRFFPGFVLMAPKDGQELGEMLRLASELSCPTAIRYPREAIPDRQYFQHNKAPLSLGKAEVLREGKVGVCLLAYGSMVAISEMACRILEREGILIGLVNARFVKPIDGTVLAKVREENAHIITLEEGVRQGGFGAAVLEWLSDNNYSTDGVERLGVADKLIEHASREEQLHSCGLSATAIVDMVKKKVKSLETLRPL